eukprot:7148765-Karenia_brevis.AAC.1
MAARLKAREEEAAGRETQRPVSVPLKLTCPNCSVEMWKHKGVMLGKCWAKLKCSGCQKTSVASKWTCPCKKQWHKCEFHRPHGLALKSTKRLPG